MKKLYLLFLALLLLFVPVTHAVAVYQLDQPVSELNGYTLREVFQNRNLAMPDLSGATDLGDGVYRFYNSNGITMDYNMNNGIYTLNGTVNTAQNVRISIGSVSNWEQGETYTTSINGLSIDSYVGNDTFETFAINTGGNYSPYWSSTVRNALIIGGTFIQTFSNLNNDSFNLRMYKGSSHGSITFINWQFTLQIEKGDIIIPYQVPSNGPYSDIDLGQLGLIPQQIQKYYDLYLEAVRFENENIEAGKDLGGYQNIFKSVINGVKGLIESMGGLWQWLNAPIITSDMSDYSFNIDWSWDLIGVIRQLMNSIGVLFLQVAFVVPNLAFAFMGIPIRISILSLLFSNMIFLILGWIIVKSFVI